MGHNGAADDADDLYGPGRIERLTRDTPARRELRARLAELAAARPPSDLTFDGVYVEDELRRLLAEHIATHRIETVLTTPAPKLDGLTLLEYAAEHGLTATTEKIQQMFEWPQANQP